MSKQEFDQMDKFDIHPQTLDPRRAGQLTRWHTWPRIKEQDVASHTWQVIRIMLALWPDAPQELIVYAMFHDIGEVATGDMPYPVKAHSPPLAAIMNHLDDYAWDCMSGRWLVPRRDPRGVPEVLGPGDLTRTFFKLVEMCEMWEWSLHERNLGNAYAALPAQRCWAHMTRLRDRLAEAAADDADLIDIVVRFDRYTGERATYEMDITDGGDSNV